MEREILAPDVKLELLLTAQDDLEKFAQEVKQVKDLEYVVSGTEFDGIVIDFFLLKCNCLKRLV
jgi:hypothetical protein